MTEKLSWGLFLPQSQYEGSFSVAVPPAWNQLPANIRNCSTLATFLTFYGNYSATLKNMKLVHCPLMGGLLHLVQRGGDWAAPQPTHQRPVYQSLYCCITARCGFNVPIKGLTKLKANLFIASFSHYVHYVVCRRLSVCVCPAPKLSDLLQVKSKCYRAILRLPVGCVFNFDRSKINVRDTQKSRKC